MLKKKTVINILLTFIIIAAAGCSNQSNIDYSNLAKCIASKDAVMYGAYWCTACAAQKKAFGDAFKYIKYIECDPRGENSKSELCLKKGIAAYPTWEFSDKTKREGVLSPEELAKITNCESK